MLNTTTRSEILNYLSFEVSFYGIEPRIWRKIAVRADETFYMLHCAIQKASNGEWYDEHMWNFSSKPRKMIAVHPEDEYGLEEDAVSAHELPLAGYFKRTGKKALYFYDYGDGWVLDVVYRGKLDTAGDEGEGILILDGGRSYPPDDCGGLYGYEVCRTCAGEKTSLKLNKAELAERQEWVGEWDPDAIPKFDVLPGPASSK